MTAEGDKPALRKSLLAARSEVSPAAALQASGALSAVLAGYRGVPLAGYMPMRGEANPLGPMSEASAYGPVGVPVIEAKATPLRFRNWTPDAALEPGAFGALIPVAGAWITPEIVIVPLVGWDARGGRLGYGGGFYDRTLEALRARGAVLSIGFGYEAQRADRLPQEPTDQRLDMIVTEAGAREIQAE